MNPAELVRCCSIRQDLSGARVTTVGYVNEEPQTCVELVEGTRNHRFGEALSAVEQRWLAARINQHIKVGLRTCGTLLMKNAAGSANHPPGRLSVFDSVRLHALST